MRFECLISIQQKTEVPEASGSNVLKAPRGDVPDWYRDHRWIPCRRTRPTRQYRKKDRKKPFSGLTFA